MRRNLDMAERIGAAPVRYPFSFVVAGDSGAWPDPTANAIFSQLLAQTARLTPRFSPTWGTSPGPGRRTGTSATWSWCGRCRSRTSASSATTTSTTSAEPTPGHGPEDRGALFHAVEITVAEDGGISGRVLQAFAADGEARLTF